MTKPPPIDQWYRYTVSFNGKKEIYIGTEKGIKNYNFVILDKQPYKKPIV